MVVSLMLPLYSIICGEALCNPRVRLLFACDPRMCKGSYDIIIRVKDYFMNFFFFFGTKRTRQALGATAKTDNILSGSIFKYSIITYSAEKKSYNIYS